MDDVEARREAIRLAKLHDPPYVLTRCDCRGGKMVIGDANQPTGKLVQVCNLCGGTCETWTTAPGFHGLYFSDRGLIEYLKHLDKAA